MRKHVKLSRMTLHRETLHRLESAEMLPVVGGLTGPPGTTCTSLLCPTRLTLCRHCP
ncbi:MAG TPA: hypothetical protein VJA16_19825 [Thermoanaerobaculia bacterium]